MQSISKFVVWQRVRCLIIVIIMVSNLVPK